jgi:hypothetical protein
MFFSTCFVFLADAGRFHCEAKAPFREPSFSDADE